MRRLTSVTALLLAVTVAPSAFGQWNLARFDEQRNRVYTTFGLDPAFVASAGYARVVPVFSHGFQLNADVGVAAAHTDTRDFRTRIGAQTSLLHWRSVNLSGTATFISRGTQNTIYRGFNFGADLTGALGVYRPAWFAAVEVGKDKAIITHITNSAYYRSTFYPGAKDGWYLDSGGTLHHGFAAGVTIRRAELLAKAGWITTERYNAVTPPMYGTLGLGFGF